MNTTNICELTELLQQCDISSSVPLSNYITLSPLPILGTAGYFLYTNRPKILAKIELADYIHADGNTRIHEYMITLSYGLNKIPWDYFINKRPLKILTVSNNTRLEYYYIPRDNDEKTLPNECKVETKSDKIKNISMLNLQKLKKLDVDSFYITTYDTAHSDFSNKISLDYYPNSNIPTKIEIRNGNKLPVRYFEITLTPKQTIFLESKLTNFPKSIKWNNEHVDDCFVDKGCLKISLKEIPKSSVELSGTVTLTLV